MILTKRVYEPADKKDGARFLVERLWPRGTKKEAIEMESWCKEASPSGELRRWFNHDPAKWTEFQGRYRAELSQNPAALERLLEAAKRGKVTLLYSARDTKHNSAVVLREYLEDRLRESKG